MDFKIDDVAKKEAVKQYIDSLPDGKSFDVSIVRHKEKRSISQNRLYHLWLNCISRETGNDIDDLHRFFAGKFLGFHSNDVFGKIVHTPVSTSSLSTEQFTEFLDRIQSFASGEGIILPLPSDLYFPDFLNIYDKQ